MEFLSGEFHGHFRTGIPLHSRHVLVLLELWHGATSSLRYIPSVETQPVHVSLYFTVITIVWHKQNEKYHAKCIQPVSVQVWRAISSSALSILRKVNGNMDSAKYQRDIIHDNEMTCECVVFQHKVYISMHDHESCHNSKKNTKERNTRSGTTSGFARHESHRERWGLPITSLIKTKGVTTKY